MVALGEGVVYMTIQREGLKKRGALSTGVLLDQKRCAADALVYKSLHKGNLQHCQNYRTIRFISHSTKVMLKIILNRWKPQEEKIIVEEQAGLRAGRSTTGKNPL